MSFLPNATLLFQMAIFIFFIWFNMKYVWPPITKAMHDREKKIAAGIEMVEIANRKLEIANSQAHSIIKTAKQHASQIIEHANLQAAQLIEKSTFDAKQENYKIIDNAKRIIEQEKGKIEAEINLQAPLIAISCVEKILGTRIHN